MAVTKEETVQMIADLAATAANENQIKILLNSKNNIYAIGDSLTAAGIYETRLKSLLGDTWDVQNLGLSGETTLNIYQRFESTVVSAGDAVYVIILAGVNDLRTGLAIADIKARLQAMYTAAQAEGIKVVAVTVTPWKNYVDANPSYSWSAGKQTDTDSLNTWIKTTATGIDYIVDAYSTLEDPSAPDALLATYDSTDHLHLSSAGYNALGDIIYSSVTWTPTITKSNLSLTADVAINQDLKTNSSPTFDGLTLTKSPLVMKAAGDETIFQQLWNGLGTVLRGLNGFVSSTYPTQYHIWNLIGLIRLTTPGGVVLTLNEDGSLHIHGPMTVNFGAVSGYTYATSGNKKFSYSDATTNGLFTGSVNFFINDSADNVRLLTLTNAGALSLLGSLTTDLGLQTAGTNDSGGTGYRLVRVPNV